MWKMLQVETAEDFVISMGESHSVREFVEKAFKVVDIDIVLVTCNRSVVFSVYSGFLHQ
jgi:GDP-D-mannose dehydratase